MSEIIIKRVCWVCNGDGVYLDATCPTCSGDGKIDKGEGIEIIDITDLTDKLDSIIAEQAAQRVDLTAALTTIINKLNE